MTCFLKKKTLTDWKENTVQNIPNTFYFLSLLPLYSQILNNKKCCCIWDELHITSPQLWVTHSKFLPNKTDTSMFFAYMTFFSENYFSMIHTIFMIIFTYTNTYIHKLKKNQNNLGQSLSILHVQMKLYSPFPL